MKNVRIVKQEADALSLLDQAPAEEVNSGGGGTTRPTPPPPPPPPQRF